MSRKFRNAYDLERRRIEITGIVQGVGFRPHVFRTATHRRLSGFVRNSSSGVLIEIEGSTENVASFLEAIRVDLPPACRITGLRTENLDPCGGDGFVIEVSGRGGDREYAIPPDIATCNDCLRELFDPSDRRYRYPFVNCTNCGPRYTIVRDIPYDRAGTTMSEFGMCPDCRHEYHDPTNRRYHAQPNACPVCGPKMMLLDAHGSIIESSDPIAGAKELLGTGSLLAVKGLGGFHLAVAATMNDSVRELRRRKNREEKPFAVMAGETGTVSTFAFIEAEEVDLLGDPARPIVLLRKREPFPLAREVAPGNRYVGAMLPYTPLHHLLFERRENENATEPVLVMTSGNPGDEPIARTDEEALESLSGIADYFLTHNRKIHQRADDSVMRVHRRVPFPVRRSRGYVPTPIPLPRETESVLGCGGHLRNTICLARGRQAWLSRHIGDLENEQTYRFFTDTIDHLEQILDIHPRLVAHDLHPDYLSTLYAGERPSAVKIAVQHHHAHIASCLAEHGVPGPVIGLACDGTGLGDDGTIWGGEVLLADTRGYRRCGHLERFPLPGGDRSVREPWRSAFSLLRLSLPGAYRDLFEKLVPGISGRELDMIDTMLKKHINAPLTSSLGRLFDAVSALTGTCSRSRYEGQAAMLLESALDSSTEDSYPVSVIEDDGMFLIETGELVRRIVDDIGRDLGTGTISRMFHNWVVRAFADTAVIVRESTGVDRVALSGGCFQNATLLESLRSVLEQSGFEVLTHSAVPTNDGGIAFGQVAVAASLRKATGTEDDGGTLCASESR